MPDSQNPSLFTGNRRRFLAQMGAGAAALAGTGLLADKAEAAPGINDAAVLNFALNLEYLEAEFYSFALTGGSLEAQGVVTGSPASTLTIKANPQVPFTTPTFQSLGAEIAADEINHVKFVRAALANLGTPPVPRPPVDLLNSFNALASLATNGVVPTFDPFANELNFFVGVFVFEDVGVTAYKGGSRLLTNKDVLENAAGILAVEAYHASTGRRILYDNRDVQVPGAPAGVTYGAVTVAISNLRARLSAVSATPPPPGAPAPGPDDQPVINDPITGGVNIVPTDANSIAFSRNPRQVLNIVYGDATGAAHSGGFFPAGLNGVVK